MFKNLMERSLLHVFTLDCRVTCGVVASMSASTLESVAAFKDRARQIGVEDRYIDKFVSKNFAAFGRYAFAIVYSPQHTDETPLINFLNELLEEQPSADQLACMRRLFFESHSMALTDVRLRVEGGPDPAAVSRKLATAERVARQQEQMTRLGGIVFTPETTPSTHLVDLFVEMLELGVLSYVKPELCCSRAQEVNAVKKDPAVSTDAAGLLKLATKATEAHCDAGSEIKLRAAWQRRNLAMDLAGLVSFPVAEGWVQFLYSHLLRDPPRGFAKISLQQILDCDKQLFTVASHRTMGNLQVGPNNVKPLDAIFNELRESGEVLQFLTPLPAARSHEPPVSSGSRPEKQSKTDRPSNKGGSKGAGKNTSNPKVQLPEGCTTHDDENRPLCFAFQNNKCKFKGPAGKRCARGYHKCYKKGCYRNKPYYLCTHTD